MYYYLGTFISSLIFIYMAEKQFKRHKKIIFILLSTIALFIPCWLAGIRGDTVGTDVMVYAIPQYNYAKSFSNFFVYSAFSGIEPLYSFLVFLCSKFNLGVSVLLFISQFLVILPLYIVGLKKIDQLSLTFFMFVYYFFFYHITLNMMRQSIACAFLMLALIYFEEGNKKKCIILCALAFLSHSSSLIAILLFFAFYYASNGRGSIVKKAVIVISAGFIALDFQNIANFIINQLGFLPSEYYNRIINSMQTNTISSFDYICRGCFVFLPFLLIFGKSTQGSRIRNYNFNSAMGYIFSLFALISQYLVRFSYFFQFMFLLTMPISVKKYTKNSAQRLLVYLALIIGILVYWYIVYIGWGWYGTMPFVINNR